MILEKWRNIKAGRHYCQCAGCIRWARWSHSWRTVENAGLTTAYYCDEHKYEKPKEETGDEKRTIGRFDSPDGSRWKIEF